MKPTPKHRPPKEAADLRAIHPVVCYPIAALPKFNGDDYAPARASLELVNTIEIPPRDAKSFDVPKQHFFRITCPEGPQVGDFNLFNAHDLTERFYSGKTRALHGTHLSTGDRIWSSFPHLRPLATITDDSLDWYGFDEHGGSVHDVIGTRCDPYTNNLLNGGDYHHCCHSNLIRAMLDRAGSVEAAEALVHDVLNVFMCTGFTKDTHQYFMKASPVRKGDYLEFMAETDVVGALSACPGGDCSASHSSDAAKCYPLAVEIYKPTGPLPPLYRPQHRESYSQSHGLQD